MKSFVLGLLLFAAAGPAFAADLDAMAAKAEAAHDPAVTVWIDATWGLRRAGAAKDLNAAHRIFGAHGYEVVSVEPYIENGDLEGFFVTYRRKTAQ
jgi:hypothetical protein